MLPPPAFRFEERLTRERLPSPSSDRTTSAPPFWFGLIFVVVGLIIIGLMSRKHDTDVWPFGMGVTFVILGIFMMVLAMDVRRPKALQARPELQDYPWDESGCDFTHTRSVVSMLGGALIFTAFSATMSLAFFFKQGHWQSPSGWSWVPGGIILLMAGASIFIWGSFVRQVLAALRFGPSHVDYTRFPYRVGEPVDLLWHCPIQMDRIKGGQFTLRCIEEWTETTRASDGERQTRIIHEALWTGTHELKAETMLERRQTIKLHWAPPDHLPRSCLAGPSVIFWRLDVKLQIAGPDFEARYLVPVY